MTEQITGAALARAILHRIDNEPLRFDMDDWAVREDCGTTLCLAGWAVVINGGQLIFQGDSDSTDEATMPDGREVSIPFEAARLLGITIQDDPYAAEFCLNKTAARRWLVEYATTGERPMWA